MEYNLALFIVQGMGVRRVISRAQENRLTELALAAIRRFSIYEAACYERLVSASYRMRGLYDQVSGYVVRALRPAEMQEVREILGV